MKIKSSFIHPANERDVSSIILSIYVLRLFMIRNPSFLFKEIVRMASRSNEANAAGVGVEIMTIPNWHIDRAAYYFWTEHRVDLWQKWADKGSEEGPNGEQFCYTIMALACHNLISEAQAALGETKVSIFLLPWFRKLQLEFKELQADEFLTSLIQHADVGVAGIGFDRSTGLAVETLGAKEGEHLHRSGRASDDQSQLLPAERVRRVRARKL